MLLYDNNLLYLHPDIKGTDVQGLRTDKHPGLFLQKQGQTRPLPCPLSENTLRVPRDLDSFGLFQFTV